MDPRDVDVSARNNHSQKGETLSFGIGWTIVIQSQGGIALKEGENDCGLLDKIVDIRPPFEFKAKITEDRDRQADKQLMDDLEAGHLSAEVFWWATLWYKSLGNEFCPHRHVVPLPPNCKQFRKEATKGDTTHEIKAWMLANLEHTTEKDATSVAAIHEALKNTLGKIEPSMRTQAGLGPKIFQYRSGPKEGHHTFYKVSLSDAKGVWTSKPVRLKSKNEPAPSKPAMS